MWQVPTKQRNVHKKEKNARKSTRGLNSHAVAGADSGGGGDASVPAPAPACDGTPVKLSPTTSSSEDTDKSMIMSDDAAPLEDAGAPPLPLLLALLLDWGSFSRPCSSWTEGPFNRKEKNDTKKRHKKMIPGIITNIIIIIFETIKRAKEQTNKAFIVSTQGTTTN